VALWATRARHAACRATRLPVCPHVLSAACPPSCWFTICPATCVCTSSLHCCPSLRCHDSRWWPPEGWKGGVILRFCKCRGGIKFTRWSLTTRCSGTCVGAFLRRPGVPGVDWMIGEHAGGRGGKEGRKGDSDAEANAAGVMNSGAICNFTPPASTTTTPAFIPLRPAHFAAGAESLASDNSGCRIPSCFHPVQPNN